MTIRKTLFAAITVAALSVNAYAADDHKGHDHDKKQGASHEHDTKPMYGGVVAEVKDINYELVAKPTSITLHVTDHGKPVKVQGSSAKIILLSKDGKEEVQLKPAGANKFEATGNFKTDAGTKVMAAVTMPGKTTTKVRFVLK